MSWLKETALTWPQKLALKLITTGPLPQHVGFIMDGNRRYAKKRNMGKVEGHVEGFHRLSDVLHWCREIGFREVTVYAFSIANFNRTVEEVNGLMNLAREKAAQAIEERDKLAEVGLKIRFFGDFSYLSDETRKDIVRVTEATKNNPKFALNICFSYTGSNDILRAVDHVLHSVDAGALEPHEITESFLDKGVDTLDSPPLDLVIRTSGEVRLSDFHLWQSDFALIHFTKVLWPEMSLWHLLGAVVHYQIHLPYLEKLRKEHAAGKGKGYLGGDDEKLARFTEDVRRWHDESLAVAS